MKILIFLSKPPYLMDVFWEILKTKSNKHSNFDQQNQKIFVLSCFFYHHYNYHEWPKYQYLFEIYDILVTINRWFEDQNWKYKYFWSLLLADFKNKIENIDFVDHHHSTHVLTKNINTVIIMCFYHRYIVNLLENYFKSSIIFALFHFIKTQKFKYPLV